MTFWRRGRRLESITFVGRKTHDGEQYWVIGKLPLLRTILATFEMTIMKPPL